MKNTIIAFLLATGINISHGQPIPASCDPLPALEAFYTWDVRNLTLRRMWELNSPDTALVSIPLQWQDTVMGGLAAVSNAFVLPERDSVFNLYCVHDLASSGIFITKEIMVFVDTSYSWTDAWQNLVTLTGDPQIDAIVTKYDLEVIDFSNFSFGNMALLATDSLWNVYALIDSLEMIAGVEYGEPNQLIGAAGRIIYSKEGNERYYTFWFQWNDCFDGCDNGHAWKFKVYEDCTVEFLGTEDWGVFGILPLPEPINCNVLTGTAEDELPVNDYALFPNPVENELVITGPIDEFAQVSIYDFTGKMIVQRSFYKTLSIGFSDFRPGIYLLHIREESGGGIVRKVIRK
jgi:hypothetical protein